MGAIPFWDNGPPELLALLDDLSSFASPWNILTIAGERLPGLVGIPTGALERAVDVKKPLGAKAATITFHGDNPASIEWDLTIWTPAQWDRYQELVPLIQPRKPDAYPQALEATYPSLALYNIKAIFFTKLGLPQIRDGIGTIKLTALEWVPKPKPVKPKPTVPYAADPANDVQGFGIRAPSDDPPAFFPGAGSGGNPPPL